MNIAYFMGKAYVEKIGILSHSFTSLEIANSGY